MSGPPRNPNSDCACPSEVAPGWIFNLQCSTFVLAAILVVGTLLAYQPVWHAGFIWDDGAMLTENPCIQAADGLRRIWFSTELPDYFPLTSTMFWLQWRLFGSDPLGYHLVNVLLHAGAAVVWWRVLARLRIPGAWLAGAIFALHPVNVESVAWISELKNTLAMVFFALALWAWIRASSSRCQVSGEAGAEFEVPSSKFEPHARRWYWFSLGFFTLALLSKTAVAPLPVVLLCLAWWQRGRITWRDIKRSLPFFAVAGLLALVTVWFQSHRAIGESIVREDNLWSRLAAAGWAVWFYLCKALLPLNLITVYPLWKIDAAKALSYLPGTLVLVTLAVCWRFRKQAWGRAGLLGLGYFVLMLLPILGFVNISFMRFSLVADRWQYFAIVGPIALVAAGVSTALKFETRNSKLGFQALALVSGAMLLVLGSLTWRHATTFTDLKTLWEKTIERNPDCPVGQLNVGDMLCNDGRMDEAIGHYETALRIQPGYAEVRNNLGTALLKQGRVNEAIASYEKAIELEPDYAEAHANLGTALLQQGRLDDAARHFRKAFEINPAHAMAHNNLGNILQQQGRREEAIAEFRKAVELRPDFAPARHNLGMSLFQSGHGDEAVAQFRKLAELQPDSANVQNNLGWMLRKTGHPDQALAPLRKAIELRPDYAEAHGNLAKALILLGNVREGADQYRAALRSQPDDAEFLSDLAWLLATFEDASVRNGNEALELAGHANQLSGSKDLPALQALAAALAECGKFAEATATAHQALKLAEAGFDALQVESLQAQLRCYQAGKPFREETKPETPSSKLE